ncbi:hypothetical protein GGR95_003814 [Sulfitobacter undariae]|uniref:Uncharacterized protein n=1 Tax=Sulfitobacter undariae TaxID=1563671 RepID=A0A7W6E9Z4_9RHOB|nr:hypothetical protein [Sulfitobacter undariae]
MGARNTKPSPISNLKFWMQLSHKLEIALDVAEK